MMTMQEMINNYVRPGCVRLILLRPERKEPMMEVLTCKALPERGLEGDRYKTKGGARQVTLIQQEHLAAAASYLGKADVDPRLIRRNLVVEGLNLLTLKGKKFSIGSAVFEYSGECHPCSRMEENLGPGGYNALRGHGGITARVLVGGVISTGDQVIPLPNPSKV